MTFPTTMLFIVAAASLNAGNPLQDDRYTWIQAEAGYIKQEHSPCVKNATALGIGGGLWIDPQWGWEITGLTSRLEDRSELWKAQQTHFHATALYSPWGMLDRWRPFLRAGAGLSHLESPVSLVGESTQRMNLVGGMGAQYLIGTRGLASVEARYVNVRTTQARSEYQLLGGLGLRWGRSGDPRPTVPVSKAVAPAPVVAPPMSESTVPEAPVLAAPVPLTPEPPVAPKPAVAEATSTSIPTASPVPAAPPTKIVLDEAVLHFANNGVVPGPDAKAAVQQVADQLKAYLGPYRLVVSGHTSSQGSKAHNQDLSRRRAEAIRKLLVEAGVPAERIGAVGCGSKSPIAENATKEGQARNRRVEIEVKPEDASIEKNRKDTGLVK